MSDIITWRTTWCRYDIVESVWRRSNNLHTAWKLQNVIQLGSPSWQNCWDWWMVDSLCFVNFRDCRTDGRTDRRTDRRSQSDRPSDRPSDRLSDRLSVSWYGRSDGISDWQTDCRTDWWSMRSNIVRPTGWTCTLWWLTTTNLGLELPRLYID